MKFKKTSLFFLILFLFVIAFFQLSPQILKAQSTENNNGLMAIFLPGIYFEDIVEARLSNFQKFKSEGAVGLINVTVPRPYHPSSNYLTLGSGTRGLGGKNSGAVYEINENYFGESAVEIYQRNTGSKVDEDVEAVAVEFPELLRKNEELDREIKPGLLGETLKEEDIKVFYHGNGDTDLRRELSKRHGALVAMESKGTISRAIMKPSKTLKRKKDFPYGYKTDYSKTKDTIEEIFRKDITNNDNENIEPFFYILELGDGMRIKHYRERLMPEKEEKLIQQTLERIDQLLGRIIELQRKKDFNILLLNPAPSSSQYYNGHRLMPLMMFPGNEESLLTSPTTRRKGLTANVDFLPTVLDELGIKPPLHLMGSPMETTSPSEGDNNLPMEHVFSFKEQYLNLFESRPPVLKSYIIIQVITMVLGLLATIFKVKIPYLKLILFSMLITPLAFVVASYFSLTKLPEVALFLLGFSLAGGIIAKKQHGDNIKKIGIICLITAFATLFPFLLGTEIIYTSLLSHDPISGARFYGLGNELMGVLIGSFTMGLFSIYHIKPLFLKSYYILGILPVLFFVHPGLGANFGGAVSSFVVFIVIILLLQKYSKKTVYIIVGAFLVFIVGLVLINLYYPELSHVGRTLELALEEGPESLVPIIVRKVSMNLTLLRYSDWSLVFLSFIAVLFFKLVKSTPLMNNLKINYPLFRNGLMGTIIGGIAAFLLNDSGVITAATMLLYVSVPLLIMGIEG